MLRVLILFIFLMSSLVIWASPNESSDSLLNTSSFDLELGKKIKIESPITLIKIHGSNTIGESLSPSLAKAYLKMKGAKKIKLQNSLIQNEKVVKGYLPEYGRWVQIFIAAHGSSTGFKSLMQGDADIWASSRPVKNKELKLSLPRANLKQGESEHVLAIDGLAIVVNNKNPIDSLNKIMLAKVFKGEINNWAQLGGDDHLIHVYARDRNSGTWDSFKNMVLGKLGVLTTAAQRFESNQELVKSVVADPYGIGFTGMAFVGKSKLLSISDGAATGFKPSHLSVATEDYTLSRRLYLYTLGQAKNHYAAEFIQFCESFDGQKIVNDQGLISQNVVALNTQLADNLPGDYVAMVQGAKRLSVNFRFNPGSAKLDSKGQKDIQRLVDFIKDINLDAKLMLIGFADKRKTSERSHILSKLRAMAVRRELSRHGIYAKTQGYGAFNPVAAFEGKSGLKNRRVEVWLH